MSIRLTSVFDNCRKNFEISKFSSNDHHIDIRNGI